MVSGAGVPARHGSVAEQYYRRRLPHWRAGEAIYFVTWRLAKGQPDLDPAERELVKSALTHFEGMRYRLAAFVVMNDHVHALISTMEPYRLEDVVHSWKSFTANQMQRDHGRRARVWQDEYFDRIVRDEEEFMQKFDYIRRNPFTRWPRLERYYWVWPADG